MRKLLIALSLSLAMGSTNGMAAAQEQSTITVVTSFPSAFYEPFREAFENEYPNWRLRVINRKTSSAISYIQRGRDDELDLFWASAPDAFEVLKRSGHLSRLSARDIHAPETIGGFPIDDPEGFYLGFALSGTGLLWNRNYLQRHDLPLPRHWEDLTDPVYHRHVAMTPPSRSGTSHLMVETILQGLGWDEGWALILAMSGNLSTLTARSYSVAEGVSRQRVGVGVTIDFLGLFYASDEDGMYFHYPSMSPFLPASVAMLSTSNNPRGAEKFIDFLLSETGQELLVRDDILRLPVSMEAYRRAPSGYPNPYAIAEEGGHHVYDSELSSRRYYMVNMLFDELVTFRLSKLSSTWQAVNEAEAKALEEGNDEAADLLEKARKVLTTIPLSEAEAVDAEIVSQLGPIDRGTPPSPVQARVEEELAGFANRQLALANDLVSQALAILYPE